MSNSLLGASCISDAIVDLEEAINWLDGRDATEARSIIAFAQSVLNQIEIQKGDETERAVMALEMQRFGLPSPSDNAVLSTGEEVRNA